MEEEKLCTCGKLPDYSAQIAAQKVTATINKVNQELSKIPENLILNLNEAIQTLMTIINGWQNTSLPSFDPDAVIAKLTALLDPVVDTLCRILDSIGLPSIPGLKQIADLLAALSAMKKSDTQKPGKLPDIPPELMQTLSDLLTAIQSLAMTLPMVCIQILFNAVHLILSTGIPVVGQNFYTIIGMVPFIKEIGDLVSLAPKLVDLMPNLGGKLSNAVVGKIKQQLKAIDDLQVPEPPQDIEITVPTKCPIHG